MADNINQVVEESLSAAERMAAESIVETSAEQVIADMNTFMIAFKDYYRLYQAKSVLEGKIKSNNFNLNVSYEENNFAEKRRQAYEAFITFQNSYNAFYNQVIKIVYVSKSEDDNFAMTIFDNNLDHVGKKTTKYYFGAIKQVFEYNEQEYNSTWLNQVAQETNRRWGIAQDTHIKSTWLPLLWKIGNWDGIKLNNAGTIAEAWATLYIMKYDFTNKGNLDVGVKEFAESGLYNVDNALGFFQGDTTGNKYENVQYAIKSKNSSLGGMTQVAKWIDQIWANVTNEMSYTDILDQLHTKVSQSGVKNQTQSLTHSIVRKQVKKMGNLIENNLPKTITIETKL